MLGIEATDDISKIRNAFKEKSKNVHPEEHPEEFRELKDAYKYAMEYAKTSTAKETVLVDISKDEQGPKENQNNDYGSDLNNEKYALGTPISILLKTGLNTKTLQIFLDELTNDKFYSIENEHDRIEISKIIEFIQQIEFIHKESTSSDVLVLREIYSKKIENAILQYCAQIYEELQFPKLERPQQLIGAINTNSHYLGWLLPKFLEMCQSVSYGNHLYLEQFSKYNFFELYEYSLTWYNKENDLQLRDKYYRIIMLYQLLDLDEYYKYDDLLYLLNANELNSDILLLMYEYGKDIRQDNAFKTELEIIEMSMPVTFEELYSRIDKMYYLYLPYENYCDYEYLNDQMKIIKEHALAKQMDPNYSETPLVHLIFEQWYRWGKLKDFYNTEMSFDTYVTFIRDLIEATWEVITTDLTYKVTKEKFPEEMSEVEDMLDLLNSYCQTLRKDLHSTDKIIELGSKLIPKLLNVYVLITSLQKIEAFEKDTDRFKLLGIDGLIVDNADRMYRTSTICPVTLIKDEDYRKFKKNSNQVSWYLEEPIVSKSRTTKMNKALSYAPNKSKKRGAIGFVAVLLVSFLISYIRYAPTVSPSKPLNNYYVQSNLLDNQNKENQEHMDKLKDEVNLSFINNDLSQIINYRDFVIEIKDQEKVSTATVNTNILARLGYDNNEITEFVVDLMAGNDEEVKPMIEHVNDSKAVIVDEAVKALNSLLDENDYSKISENNRESLNLNEQIYEEIRLERNNGNNKIARDIIEEYIEGY